MKICESCGLPVRVCDALTHWRSAGRLLRDGRIVAARDEHNEADAMFQQYVLEMLTEHPARRHDLH
jgi:hypothetical protein